MTSPAEPAESSRIRILEATHIYNVGSPIVVLEWWQGPMGAAVNYWILIPGPPCDLKGGQYGFEVWGPQGADMMLLVDAAQESCRCWLQAHVADKIVRKRPELTSAWPVVQLRPAERKVFLSAWMEGKCTAAIERLSNEVRDRDLRNILSLLRSIQVTKSER